jgi:hypothetical protein
MENINRDGHKLLFKGEEYDLGKLISQAKTGHLIEVKIEELTTLGVLVAATEPAHWNYVSRFNPELAAYTREFIAFYPQEGKMTVLFGRDKLKELIASGAKTFKGRLVPQMMLKKSRIDKPEPVAIVAPAPAPTPQFNAPRFDDRRRSSTTNTDRRDTAPRRGLENSRPYSDRPQRATSPTSNNRTTTRGDFRKS